MNKRNQCIVPFSLIFFQVHRAVIAPRGASVSADEGEEGGGRGERGGVEGGVAAREGRETVQGEGQGGGRWVGGCGGGHAVGGRKEIDIAVKIVHPGVHTAACADVQVLRLLSRLVG